MVSNFAELYRKHATDVYRFALWMCADRVAAEDITAETFARAFAGADEARAATAKGYLLTIARHLVWRWRARRVHADEAAVAAAVDHGPGVDAQVAAADELRAVLQELARLSDSDREAVVLRADHDLSYDEIARVLGITEVAAKVKVHRARLRLAAVREGYADLAWRQRRKTNP